MTRITDRDILLFAVGVALRKFGTLVQRSTPPLTGKGEEQGESVVRTGLGAWRAVDGSWRQAAANTARGSLVDLDGDHVYETLGLLVEPSRTQAYTWSADLTNAAWNKVRSSVAGAAGIISPFAVASASSGVFAFTEDNTDGQHHFNQALPSLTDNTQQTATLWARPSSRTWLAIQTTDKSNTVRRSWVNLSTGALGTVDAGHRVIVRPGNLHTTLRWRRIGVSWNSSAGATTPTLVWLLSTGDTVHSYLGDGASQFFVFNPVFSTDQRFPTSDIISTAGSTVTRGAETVSLSVGIEPQDMSWFVRLYIDYWLDLADTGSLRFLSISDSDESDFLRFSKVSTLYQFAGSQQGAGGTVLNAGGVFPAGTRLLDLVLQYDHTNGQLRTDPGTGAFGAWVAVNNKLAVPLTALHLGSTPGGANQAAASLLAVIGVRGFVPAADFRALVP